MKILSLTMGSAYNLGDQAIQDVIQCFFQQLDMEIISGKFYPFDFEDEVTETKQLKKTPPLKRSVIKRVLKKIKLMRWFKTQYECRNSKINIKLQLDRYCRLNFKMKEFDIILIGGGQFIKHNHDFLYCLQYWVEYFKCPVHLLGIGCDKYFSSKEKKLYSRILRSCDQIYVRDNYSLALMKRDFGIDAQFIPDVVFLYNKLFDVSGDIMPCVQFISVYDFETARNCFGFMDKKSYYELWLRLIEETIDHTVPIIFGASTYEDYMENKIFMEFYKGKFPKDNVQLCRTETVSGLVEILAKAERVYSARMHILILAVAVGVENLIAFPISEKLREFKRMYLKTQFNLEALQEDIETKLENIITWEVT